MRTSPNPCWRPALAAAAVGALSCTSAPAEPAAVGSPSRAAQGQTARATTATAAPAHGLGRCRFPGELAPCREECAAANEEACAVLGLVYLREGDRESVARGVELLERSCAAKVALGCGGLGALYVGGPGVARDVERGRALFLSACGGGDGLSCESLGGLFAMGEHGPVDLKAAAGWYDKACELGRPAACAFLASFILDGALGPGTERARAAGLLRRACDGEVNTACKMLGDLYAKGELVARDAVVAAELYARACALGSELGCQAAGRRP